MDPKTLRKRQIAKRLGVSEQVLEQYLQLKRAEVVHPKNAPETTESAESNEVPARERRGRQRHATRATRDARRPTATTGAAKRAADNETR